MKPLSREELEALKSLKLEDIAGLPMLHSEDISYIFFYVLPKLIEVAEDHSILSKRTTDQDLKNQMERYNSFLIEEGSHISSLILLGDMLKKVYDEKTKIAESIVGVQKVSFPRSLKILKFWDFIKREMEK